MSGTDIDTSIFQQALNADILTLLGIAIIIAIGALFAVAYFGTKSFSKNAEISAKNAEATNSIYVQQSTTVTELLKQNREQLDNNQELLKGFTELAKSIKSLSQSTDEQKKMYDSGKVRLGEISAILTKQADETPVLVDKAIVANTTNTREIVTELGDTINTTLKNHAVILEFIKASVVGIQSQIESSVKSASDSANEQLNVIKSLLEQTQASITKLADFHPIQVNSPLPHDNVESETV